MDIGHLLAAAPKEWKITVAGLYQCLWLYAIIHKLVEVALEKHHAPQKTRDLILDYINILQLV